MNMASFWRSYKDNVVPSNAPDVQVLETQMAFYAGGVALTAIVRSMDKSDPIAAFKAIEDELQLFAAEIGAKHATIN